MWTSRQNAVNKKPLVALHAFPLSAPKQTNKQTNTELFALVRQEEHAAAQTQFPIENTTAAVSRSL